MCVADGSVVSDFCIDEYRKSGVFCGCFHFALFSACFKGTGGHHVDTHVFAHIGPDALSVELAVDKPTVTRCLVGCTIVPIFGLFFSLDELAICEKTYFGDGVAIDFSDPRS